MRDRIPALFRLPEVNFIDDKTGKPVGSNEGFGRRPTALGNSDGDLEMLQWPTISDGVGFGAIVHHTDAERGYAYDKKSHFGRLDAALDGAAANKWTMIDVKKDWKVVFRSKSTEFLSALKVLKRVKISENGADGNGLLLCTFWFFAIFRR
jgi:hypothetical protein